MTAKVYTVTVTVWYSTPTGTTYDSGTVWINVNGFQVSTSYGQTSTGSSVASALATALNGSGSPVTASASGSGISLTSRATGSISNYSLSAGSSTANPGGYFSNPSFTVSLSGNTLTG